MNIYISNLNYNVTDGDLRTLFTTYGEVSSAKVITDRETGRSRGFGFVEIADTDAAKNAIKELNESDFQGNQIMVNEARPKEDRPRNNFGGGDGGYRRDNKRGGDFKSNNNSRDKRW